MKDINEGRRNLLKAAPLGAAALLVGAGSAMAQTTNGTTPAPSAPLKIARASAFLVKVDSLDPALDPVKSSVITQAKAGERVNLLGTPLAQPYLIQISRDEANSTDAGEFYTVSILDLKGKVLNSSNMDEASSVTFTKQQIAISLRVLS
ncbi:MAG TPA: hypothetical protein VD865_13505 [Stenotrophomonas sp.]|nr:hypothetical protein [Stenotrophomonas sp.]